jgi:ATP-dependent Clp protease adapter protein ClpS
MSDDTATERSDETWRGADSTWGDDLTAISPKAGIIFHDDSETPVDFALHLLQRYVGHDEATARQLVKAVADEGSCEVIALPKPQAEIMLERLLRVIDIEGYPFKVSMKDLS